MKKSRQFVSLCILILILLICVFISYSSIRFLTGLFVGDLSVSIDPGIKVYADNFNGSTTDFLHMSDAELGSIENMILENSKWGKIVFSQAVNLTRDVVSNIVDLNSNVNISYNYIEINTMALTSLEKPVTLYLYGLTFSNSRVLRNGEVCSASICQKIDYSGGTLVFSVTEFSNSIYSAEETPSVTPPLAPPSGGGGAITGKADFVVTPDFISVTIYQEEGKGFELGIKNTGGKKINITLEISDLNELVILTEKEFVIDTDESKRIRFDLFVPSKTNPGIYTGKILVKGESLEKTVNIVIEIKERYALFDIKLSILPDYKKVNPGESMLTHIEIKNIGLYGKTVDVELQRYVMDFDKKVLFESSKEIIAVEKEISIKRELTVPLNFPLGKYIAIAELKYKNITIDAHDSFDVVEKEYPKILKNPKFLALILICILILIIPILQLVKKKKISVTAQISRVKKMVVNYISRLQKSRKI